MSKIDAIKEMERNVGDYLTALEDARVSQEKRDQLGLIFENFLGAVDDYPLFDERLTRQISVAVFDNLEHNIDPRDFDFTDVVGDMLTQAITSFSRHVNAATMPPPPPGPLRGSGGGSTAASLGAGGGASLVNDPIVLDFIQRYNYDFQITADATGISDDDKTAAKEAIEHVSGFRQYVERGGLANRRVNFIKDDDSLLGKFDDKKAEYVGYEFKTMTPPGLSKDERLDKLQGTLRNFYLEQEQYIASHTLTPQELNIETFYNNLEIVLNIAHPQINLVDFLVDIGNQKSELKCFGPLLHNAVLDTSSPVGDHYLNGDNLGNVIDYYCSKGAKNELNTVFEHPNFKSLVQNSSSQRAVFQALSSSIKTGKLTKLFGDNCTEIIKKATDDLPPKDQNKLLTQIDRSQSKLPEAKAVAAWGSQPVEAQVEPVRDDQPNQDNFLDTKDTERKSSKVSDEKAPTSQTTKNWGLATVVAAAIGGIVCFAVSGIGTAALGMAIFGSVGAVGFCGVKANNSMKDDQLAHKNAELANVKDQLQSAYQDRGHDRQDNRNREYSHVQEHQQREAGKSNGHGGRGG